MARLTSPFRSIVVLTLLLAGAVSGQMKLTVNQLMTFIESSIRLKHEDKRVAEYLKKVKLSEKLEDRMVEVLMGKGAGPYTINALRTLAADSTSLPKAAPPVAKPVAPVIPPPSEQEQREVIESARQYALSYTRRLPDFICTQVTRRFYDPTGLEFWQRADVITERLSYFEQKEDYKVILINSRPAEGVSRDQLGGATSSGEFGSLLKEVFEPESDTYFRWDRWATLRGRRVHVYNYLVSQPKSKWRIDYQKTMSIVAGYRGLIYVDAQTLAVMQITLDATDIPPSFPVQQAKTLLAYDFVKIGEMEHVLPLRAEVRMREGRNLVKNEVEFRMYRKFGAEAVIKFDTPDALPEDLLQEQPAAPGAQAPPAKIPPPAKTPPGQ
ncbi:MAG: hypothetical protein JNL98_23555 [Bryobacterales bacterium]|nr:hypothetical protein [Bryobacterales bacterium]